MPNDRRGNNRHSNQSRGRDENLSSSFTQYASALDKNSAALMSAVKSFETLLNKMDKNTSQVGNISDKDRKSQSEMVANMASEFDKSSKNLNNSLTTGQKIGKSLIETFKIAGKVLIDEFTRSVGRVSDAYLSNLTAITSRMDLSNKQYASMMNDAAKEFKSSDLTRQFSPVDYAEALTTTLSEGLRGEEAKRQAYQNLITNRLVPAISTNTTSYRQMSKVFKDSFTENIAAMAKYTESVYGAEGIEEGKVNSMLDSLKAQIMYAAGGDAEKANTAINNLVASMSYMEQNNLDSSKFIQDLYQAATGQIGSNSVMSAMWGNFTPDDMMNNLFKGGQLVENYIKAYAANTGSANLINAYGNAMGADVDQMYMAGAFLKQRGTTEGIASDIDSFISKYDKDTTYQKYLGNLSEGYYMSADKALDKQEENWTTWIATAKSNLARFDTVIKAVKDIGLTLANIWLFTKTTQAMGGGGSSGLGSAFKSVFTKSGAKTATDVGEQLALPGFESAVGGSAAKSGIKAIGSKAATGLKSVGSKLGAAAKVLGPVAGGVMTVADMVTGYKEGGIEQSLYKGLTGASDHESYKTGGIDALKDAAKDTMKNAAKGALIGSVVPGVGTAVGAGIGMVAGIAGSLGKYFSEENQLSRATKAYAEVLEKATAAQTNYEKVTEKSADNISALAKGVKMSDTEFQNLKSAYPKLLSNIETQSDLDESYIKIIESKIQLEKKEATEQLLKDTKGMAKKGAKLTKKLASQSSTFDLAGKQFLVEASKSGTDASAKLSEIASTYGVSEEEVLSQAQRLGIGYDLDGVSWDAESKKIVTSDGTELSKALQSSGNEYQKQYGTYTEDIADLESNIAAVYDKALELYTNTSSILQGMGISSDKYPTLSDKDLSEYGIYGSRYEPARNLKTILQNYNNELNNLKDMAQRSPSEATRNKFSTAEGLASLFDIKPSAFKKLGISSPAFKVGLGYVPSDNYPALLHKGEMVLTSANADLMRELTSGSSVSSLLSSLVSLKKDTAVTTVGETTESTASDAVVTAINSQTEVLSNLLTTVITTISSVGNKPQSNPATVSAAVVAFEGA